jgi:hypothetical protein
MYSSADVGTEEEEIMLGDNDWAGGGDAIAVNKDGASVAHENYITSVGVHCGPWKLGLLLSAIYGPRKLDNFHQLPITPTEITLPEGRQ